MKIFDAFREFVPNYHHVNFGGDWTTDKGETWGTILTQEEWNIQPNDYSSILELVAVILCVPKDFKPYRQT